MKKITLKKELLLLLVLFIFPIVSKSQTVLSFENFESTLGIYTAGSGNVSLNSTAPYQGSKSVRFNGTTGMTLATPATGIATLPFNKIDVKFFVRASANTGETISLQYRANSLAVWTNVRTITLDATKDMRANNTYYAFYATLFSTDYTFSAFSQFQFVTVLGNSSRYFYLDNVSITGTTYNTITKGPGGITSNLETWLKADKINGTGIGVDNTAVNSWEDVGKGNDATVIDATNASFTNKPSYRNNSTDNVNFNPVVYFNNDPLTSANDYTSLANRAELNGTGGFYTNEQYIVVVNDTPATINSTTPSIDLFCAQGGITLPYDTDGTGFGFGKYTIRTDGEVVSYCHGTTPGAGTGTPIASRGYGVCQNSLTDSYNKFIGILSSRNNTAINGQELFYNANKIDNMEVGVPQFSNFGNKRYWLGRSQVYNGSFGGRIAEVITFSNRKNDVTERRKIESYLGIKYGITLGVNGVTLDYQNSNGNVIWAAAANSGYDYDIAGIGRDDASELNQKQSKSINATEVMTIGLSDVFTTNSANTSAFDVDKKFLVWGSNGGAMTNTGTPFTINLGPTTVTTFTEIVNRRWKIVETGGDVPTVRLNIPTASFVSGLPPLGPTDAYVMIIADDAAFTTSLETVFMSTSGSNQTLLYDFDGTRFFTFGVAHRATNPLHISLDGVDDYVRISDANELSTAFTIMTWIRPNGSNTLADERTIIAKKPDANSGYRLVLQNNNKVRMEWSVLGTTYSSITNTAIPDLKWHNIAVTYSASTLNIYIDGVLDKTTAIVVAPTSTTSTFSIGSQYVSKLSILNLFKGDIDELRMWSRMLTLTEIRFLMNQEIVQNGTGTRGAIIPSTITKNDVNSLLWSNLYAYYSMNSYIGTHLDDDSGNVHRGSLIIPNKISINVQTAPMPYVSLANGSWASTATWANGSIQDLPYSLSIIDGTTPVSWNIVKTAHNIDSNGNKVLLGLFVNSNTLSASNDSKLEVSHYLKLDGKIDLVGMSQLIQSFNSDLDQTSSGSLERDQQGTKNMFNYNYWSSPVGAINNSTNNNAFTVAGVMKDGTTSTPQNITWTSGLNGSPTSPITLSNYWIFKFQNLSNSYANWQSAGSAGLLNSAQGFTLKGSGTASSTQNYTFVGKPNNGLITTTVAIGNLNLTGNPYSSALDANAFISANSSSITGSLYFWEHSSTNNTHTLVNYQGGYSIRNLTGGTGPSAPAGISGVGSSAKVPKQFIPVGQGFFVVGSATGGTINYNNDQRLFIKETDATSTTLFRNNNSNILSVNQNHFNDNTSDATTSDTFSRIRLGLTSKDNYHRQILLGFMEQNATSSVDFGYDAINIDNQPNDMYFINNGTTLNIQGEGYFNINNVYPIGIKTNVFGEVKIMLDATENLDDSQRIFIHDNTDDAYHEITNNEYIVELPQGLTNNRFSLTFKNNSVLGVNNFNDLNNGIVVAYANTKKLLSIKNNVSNTTVEKVSLFNILGQLVKSFDVKDQNQQNIELPLENLSTGTYIVKVKTDKGETTRKIVFN